MSSSKTKNNPSQVISNNFYFLKLIFKASPAFVIFPALDALRNSLSIFFEHTLGIGYVLEAAENGYPLERVLCVIMILAGAVTLGMILAVVTGDYIGAKERPKVRQKIKLMLYEKASKVDLSCYDDPEHYNSQVLAISEIDNQIERCTTLINKIVSGLSAVISNGIYFIVKDKPSILFVIASFVMNCVFNQIYIKISYKKRIERNPLERKRKYVERIFYLNDYAKEIRMNPKVADILNDTYKMACDELIDTDKKYTKKLLVTDFLRNHIANFFICDTLYVSYLIIMAVVFKSIPLSTLAILYTSFSRLKTNLNVFTETYPFACETSLYVQRIRDFLDVKPKIVSEKNELATKNAKSIDLKSVSFSYKPDAQNTINNISLSIKPGYKIALVGYNGAGKTTLVKLLMRLYDPTTGSIEADGKNIKDYNVESYRDSIGVVFQDFNVFAGSIKENVTLAPIENANENKIVSSLKESGLYNRTMSLASGLDTMLTTEFDEQGLNLSGGEAQKLAISRVFYKDAGLMILDEPSSALDPIAEYQLNHAMIEATGNKTVIFISHRLSTTRLADQIYMLENGQVVEQGNHDQLLALDGKYAEMWKAQAGTYID